MTKKNSLHGAIMMNDKNMGHSYHRRHTGTSLRCWRANEHEQYFVEKYYELVTWKEIH